MYKTATWLPILTAAIGLLVGVTISDKRSGVTVGYSYKYSSAPVISVPLEDDTVLIIRVDSNLETEAVYRAKYSVDAEPQDQWVGKTTTFTFRQKDTARQVHDAISRLMRDEMARILHD